MTRSRRRYWAAAAAAGSAVLGACLFPTDTCACVYPPPYVLPVSGTVSEASGRAAAGIHVEALVFAGACPPTDADDINVVTPFSATDPDGHFRIALRAAFAVAEACVRVRVYATSLDATPLATAERYPVRVDVDPRGLPVDSVRVAIVLP